MQQPGSSATEDSDPFADFTQSAPQYRQTQQNIPPDAQPGPFPIQGYNLQQHGQLSDETESESGSDTVNASHLTYSASNQNYPAYSAPYQPYQPYLQEQPATSVQQSTITSQHYQPSTQHFQPNKPHQAADTQPLQPSLGDPQAPVFSNQDTSGDVSVYQNIQQPYQQWPADQSYFPYSDWSNQQQLYQAAALDNPQPVSQLSPEGSETRPDVVEAAGLPTPNLATFEPTIPDGAEENFSPTGPGPDILSNRTFSLRQNDEELTAPDILSANRGLVSTQQSTDDSDNEVSLPSPTASSRSTDIRSPTSAFEPVFSASHPPSEPGLSHEGTDQSQATGGQSQATSEQPPATAGQGYITEGQLDEAAGQTSAVGGHHIDSQSLPALWQQSTSAGAPPFILQPVEHRQNAFVGQHSENVETANHMPGYDGLSNELHAMTLAEQRDDFSSQPTSLESSHNSVQNFPSLPPNIPQLSQPGALSQSAAPALDSSSRSGPMDLIVSSNQLPTNDKLDILESVANIPTNTVTTSATAMQAKGEIPPLAGNSISHTAPNMSNQDNNPQSTIQQHDPQSQPIVEPTANSQAVQLQATVPLKAPPPVIETVPTSVIDTQGLASNQATCVGMLSSWGQSSTIQQGVIKQNVPSNQQGMMGQTVGQQETIGRPNAMGQHNSMGQPNVMRQSSAMEQLNMMGQPNAMVQPNVMGQSSAMGQLNAMGQPNVMGQSSAMGQPGVMGQPNVMGQSSAMGQPNVMGQSSAMGQPSVMGQPNAFGQTNTMGQPSIMGQLNIHPTTPTSDGNQTMVSNPAAIPGFNNQTPGMMQFPGGMGFPGFSGMGFPGQQGMIGMNPMMYNQQMLLMQMQQQQQQQQQQLQQQRSQQPQPQSMLGGVSASGRMSPMMSQPMRPLTSQPQYSSTLDPQLQQRMSMMSGFKPLTQKQMTSNQSGAAFAQPRPLVSSTPSGSPARLQANQNQAIRPQPVGGFYGQPSQTYPYQGGAGLPQQGYPSQYNRNSSYDGSSQYRHRSKDNLKSKREKGSEYRRPDSRDGYRRPDSRSGYEDRSLYGSQYGGMSSRPSSRGPQGYQSGSRPDSRNSQCASQKYSTTKYSSSEESSSDEEVSVPARKTPAKFPLPHTTPYILTNGCTLEVQPNSPDDGQPAIVSMVQRLQLVNLNLNSFTEPLVKGQTHKQEVIDYCNKMAAESRSNAELIDRDSSSLLWRILAKLVQQNGTYTGTDIAELLVENTDLSTAEFYPNPTTAQNKMDSVERCKSLDKYRDLIIQGNAKAALEFAMTSDQWGHALYLSSKMGAKVQAQVINRFCNNSMNRFDPLLTSYHLLSNRQPAACTTPDDRWGAWRSHLAAMLTSANADKSFINRCLWDIWPTFEHMLKFYRNKSVARHPSDSPAHECHGNRCITTLGDSLAQRGLVIASQICYLMAEHKLEDPRNRTAKLSMLTVRSGAPVIECMKEDVIRCTEVLEFVKSLSGDDTVIPHLQVYKFMKTLSLIDQGQPQDALSYCENIGQKVIQNSHLFNFQLIKQLHELSSRLMYYDPTVHQLCEGEEFKLSWVSDLENTLNAKYKTLGFQTRQKTGLVASQGSTVDNGASGQVAQPEGVGGTETRDAVDSSVTQAPVAVYNYNNNTPSASLDAQAPAVAQSTVGTEAQPNFYQSEADTGQIPAGAPGKITDYTTNYSQYANQSSSQAPNQYSGTPDGTQYADTQYNHQYNSGMTSNQTTNHYSGPTNDTQTNQYRGPTNDTQTNQYSEPQVGQYGNQPNGQYGGDSQYPGYGGYYQPGNLQEPQPPSESDPTSSADYLDYKPESYKAEPPSQKENLSNSDQLQQQIKEVRDTSQPTTKTTLSEDSSATKDSGSKDSKNKDDKLSKSASGGGLGSTLFGFVSKMMPKGRDSPKEIILPKDDKPSIIWDEKLKKYVNLDGDTDEADAAPPPPKDIDLIVESAAAPNMTGLSAGPTGQSALPPPPGANKFSMKRSKSGKYVDLMSRSGASSPAPTHLFDVTPRSTPPTPIFNPGINTSNAVSSSTTGTTNSRNDISPEIPRNISLASLEVQNIMTDPGQQQYNKLPGGLPHHGPPTGMTAGRPPTGANYGGPPMGMPPTGLPSVTQTSTDTNSQAPPASAPQLFNPNLFKPGARLPAVGRSGALTGARKYPQ